MHLPVNAEDQRPLKGPVATNQLFENAAEFLELLQNPDGFAFLEEEDLEGVEVEDLVVQMTLAGRLTT